MGSEKYLLDTSAVLTLIEDEAGAGRVEEVLRQGEIFLPWLVLLEVSYISRQERGQAVAEQRYALLRQVDARIIWQADEPLLLTAARFKAEHRLSLADAVIAASASSWQATLLHKDPEYEVLAGEIKLEALPYKKG